MFYVFGSRLYGKVDEVPGLFHVATKFGHLNFVPLIPTQSYVVLAKNGNTFRGVPIPMSAKSVFVTWGRAISFVAMVLGGIFALVSANSYNSSAEFAPLVGVAVFGAALFCFLTFYKGVTRASFNRACQLAQMIGMTERGYAELQRIYGQAAGRGFDVSPAASGQSGAAPQQGYAQQNYGQAGYAQPTYAQPTYAQQTAQPAYAAAQAAAPAYSANPLDDDEDRGAYTLDGEAPAGPQTFWLRGTHRQSGQAVCVPVVASNGRQARAMGDAQGIDVATVQYQDGRLA